MKPIPFNSEMVRAILDGRKTVTRRVINPRYRDDESGFQVITNAHTGEFVRVEKIDEDECGVFADGTERYVNPPYQTGEVLWVRETWNGDWCDHYIYKADGGSAVAAGYASEPKWRPSIHMPREAARIFLRVTDVRAERLQEISARQCEKEGMTSIQKSVLDEDEYWYWFKNLWDSTIKPADRARYGWEANPWVWVIEFERISRERALEGERDV